jgi:hypothetical protein
VYCPHGGFQRCVFQYFDPGMERQVVPENEVATAIAMCGVRTLVWKRKHPNSFKEFGLLSSTQYQHFGSILIFQLIFQTGSWRLLP